MKIAMIVCGWIVSLVATGIVCYSVSEERLQYQQFQERAQLGTLQREKMLLEQQVSHNAIYVNHLESRCAALDTQVKTERNISVTWEAAWTEREARYNKFAKEREAIFEDYRSSLERRLDNSLRQSSAFTPLPILPLPDPMISFESLELQRSNNLLEREIQRRENNDFNRKLRLGY